MSNISKLISNLVGRLQKQICQFDPGSVISLNINRADKHYHKKGNDTGENSFAPENKYPLPSPSLVWYRS